MVKARPSQRLRAARNVVYVLRRVVAKACLVNSLLLLLFFLLLSWPAAFLPALAAQSAQFTQPVQAGEDIFVLNLASQYPEDHPAVRAVLRPWAQELLRRSKGRLVIRIFGPNALCGEESLSQAVRLGQVALAYGCLGLEAEYFPLGSISGLRLGPRSAPPAGDALWRAYAETPELTAEFRGIKLLALHSAPPVQIFMLKDGVYGAADLAGQRLLTHTPVHGQKVALLGAEAIASPLADFFSRLQEGEADGALLTLRQARERRLEQYFRQAALPDMEGGLCWLGIHQGLWDILPPDLRKILTDSGGSGLSLALAAAAREDDKAGLERLRAGNMQVHYFSAEERDKLLRLTQEKLLEYWLRGARLAGVGAPRVLYDKIGKIVSESGGI